VSSVRFGRRGLLRWIVDPKALALGDLGLDRGTLARVLEFDPDLPAALLFVLFVVDVLSVQHAGILRSISACASVGETVTEREAAGG